MHRQLNELQLFNRECKMNGFLLLPILIMRVIVNQISNYGRCGV